MSGEPANDREEIERVNDKDESSPSFVYADLGDKEKHEKNEDITSNPGDYSSRLDEILSDEENEVKGKHSYGFDDGSSNEDDEGFLYSGIDAQIPSGYQDQLHDVLGTDAEPGSDEDQDHAEVEKEITFIHTDGTDEEFSYDGQSRLLDHINPPEPSTPSTISSLKPLHSAQSTPLRKPFLHPTVSRLRSMTPQRIASFASSHSLHSDLHSPQLTHMSTLSRSSTISDLRQINGAPQKPREAFRWTSLRMISDELFRALGSESNAEDSYGHPTVLSSNGMICVGTESGRVLVFDFKQKLKCVCGTPISVRGYGGVTAVALSQDHTFIAAGHSTGHIFLYNLSKPTTPARSVPTTTLIDVASGRKEGHLPNVRISSIGFVSARHTAIVSADENGLAFYHSLGKVLFVEANDVLRILGKYPDKGSSKSSLANKGFMKPRKNNTILAMAPLPLGTSPDPVDDYNLIALLTPVKLVIVGLKPSPRTWHRRHRTSDAEQESSKWRGCLAWLPIVMADDLIVDNVSKEGSQARPMLVYSWGKDLFLLRVREEKTTTLAKNPKTDKMEPIVTGKVVFEEPLRWTASDDVLAVEWLNANLIVGFLHDGLVVWDAQNGSCVESSNLNILPISLPWNSDLEMTKSLDASSSVSHSIRTYKNKVFTLCSDGVKVGTLMSWADRVLALVQEGKFLNAIDLVRAYYLGHAPGNRMGLPADSESMRKVVGTKLKELMLASANYAFAEERLTDETHVTPDGRGVDRTSLFEGIVSTCAKACVALDDFVFLYEDLFERYQNWGIVSIFLAQLEPFVLDSTIRFVPPRITQQLIASHAQRGDLSRAERLIWHIDPQCLDIDQAIKLCKDNDLWDALIYTFCAALHDFVSPVVELMGLIRRINHLQRRLESHRKDEEALVDELERVLPFACKVFPYLSDVLSGLTYPSQSPMPEHLALEAKKDIYIFLFFGRSSVWPKGGGGKFILIAEEEGGVEPTYPYLRLLLRFDAEACLHTLDIAFEDSFLNERSHNVSRLVIVKILLEFLESPDLPPSDATFVNIFIAKNVPKYPQYMDLVSPSALKKVLIGLAHETDENTQEDRQLATEYLLSVYNPRHSEEVIQLFQKAKFYRILRSWYRQDHRWQELMTTYIEDRDVTAGNLFQNVSDLLDTVKGQGHLPLWQDLSQTFMRALPSFLQSNVMQTATLVERHFPNEHANVLQAIGEESPHEQFEYIQVLLEPQEVTGDQASVLSKPSRSLKDPEIQRYIFLLCEYHPQRIINVLATALPPGIDWEAIEHICSKAGLYGATIWSLDARDESELAFAKLQKLNFTLGRQLLEQLNSPSMNNHSVAMSLDSFKLLADVSLAICKRHSEVQHASSKLSTEEMWFRTLASQIDLVQTISGRRSKDKAFVDDDDVLQTLRAAVQTTFTSLMSLGSSVGIEFPQLFKRLVDSTSLTRSMSNASYSEFRIILSGMLDSYHFEEDLLESTTHLVQRDLLAATQALSSARNKGWRPTFDTCKGCNKKIAEVSKLPPSTILPSRIAIIRTGASYHLSCLPNDISN